MGRKATIKDININIRSKIENTGELINNMIAISFSIGSNDVCISFIEGLTHQIDLCDSKRCFNIKTDEDIFLKVYKNILLIKRNEEYNDTLKKNVMKLYKEVIKIYENQS